jgi:hypothetical protein
MGRDTASHRADPARFRWALATLPLAALALFAYGAFEWLFFATKPSVVSVLPFSEQLTVLLLAPLPFVGPILAFQLGATLLSLLLPVRMRWVAALPAAALLTALVLVLADNFLLAAVGFSLTSSGTVSRIAYGTVLVGALVLWLRKLSASLPRAASENRTLILLWSVAIALIVTATLLQRSTTSASAPLPTLSQSNRPNVLILSIDGVDAHRLSAYESSVATSPFLESLRDETLFCENAFSNASQTYTSQTSLLTGRLPFTTRVIVPPSILRGDDAFLHLPGIFRRSGYRSLQLSMRHFGDAEDANVREGFSLTNYRWENRLTTQRAEHTHDIARPFRLAAVDRLDARLARIFGTRLVADEFAHVTGASDSPYWRDTRRVAALTEFIDASPSPWFAHVHLLDTHVGHHDKKGPERVGPDRYDNLLRDADDRVREVLTHLTHRGQLEKTIIVLTSDHGSSKGPGTAARIPLLFRFPGRLHARREQNNTQALDVAPTVLDFAGVPIPGWMEGRSLLRPEHVSDDRVIFVAGGGVPSAAEGLLALDLPQPPNYGARKLHAIHGSFWYELDLRTGSMASAPVQGHTKLSQPVSVERARGVILEMLERRHFTVSTPVPQ